MDMHDISYDWLKLVEKALLKVHQLPNLEEHFPFPWEAAGHALQQSLGLSHLTLSCSRSVWKGPHDFLQGMGDQPSIVAFEIAPIEGSLFFVLPQADMEELTASALTAGENKESFSGPKLQQGFYHLLLLKALQTLDHLKVLKDVSLHLLQETPFPQENGFCIDIALALASRTLMGRLICPQSFFSAFKSHQPLQKTTLLSMGSSSPIDVTLRCQVGHTSVSSEEWESIQVGDFLILDRCSFDPLEGKGSLTLSLGETPLLMARLKPEGLKVLDYAFYHETSDFEDSSDLEDDSSDFDEELSDFEEETEELEEDEAEIADEDAFNPHFELTVEVGRVDISLQELLKLQAGSLIELPLRPEQGVSVVRSGQRVAKAELVKLGEVIGLRLLDIER